MAAAQTDDLAFEAPGPGTWERDLVHFPRPVSRYFSDVHPGAFRAGTELMFGHYGLLLHRMESAYPNGFCYNTRVPAPDAEIPDRFARGSEALAEKAWREQLREWDEESKPAALRFHREIQAVDPDALSDEELAEYLIRCRDHHARMITQHMRFTASAMIPVGDLMAHLMEWTTVQPAEILGLMRGASPVSAGASGELERLLTALDRDDDARALLESDRDPSEVLEQLRARGDEVGAAMGEYLELVGFRLLDGFDIAGRYALELPDALVRAIRSAGSTTAGDADTSSPEDAIRAQVPAEHQAQFDELLAEARLVYRLRDERGVFSDIWASGLMRRAAMAAGRRLAASGRLHDAQHIVDATAEEMAAMVTGTGGPSADEIEERFTTRTALTGREGPTLLGDPPMPPPDLSGLPPDTARLMAAMMIAIGALFGSSEEEHSEEVIRGLAASPGVYEGTARRVGGPEEFDRIVEGDVLVTESTSEAFNILLPLLGAIVTDAGGLLSHPAIVSREYGIPGVVGTRDATQLIADGTRVRVDGDAGEVSVLP
jgi:phosphohistidine swiveling domain-containing protein